jgi:hypothetical protein
MTNRIHSNRHIDSVRGEIAFFCAHSKMALDEGGLEAEVEQAIQEALEAVEKLKVAIDSRR